MKRQRISLILYEEQNFLDTCSNNYCTTGTLKTNLKIYSKHFFTIIQFKSEIRQANGSKDVKFCSLEINNEYYKKYRFTKKTAK